MCLKYQISFEARMTFNPNVPLANQTIASTQAPIQTNFQLIDQAFDNSTGDFTQFAIQNVSAPSAPVNPVSVIHTKNDASGTPQLWFLNSAGDTQITGGATTSGAWCQFNFTNASPITPNDGFNVTNITKVNGTTFTLNFTNAFAQNKYAVIAIPSISTGSYLFTNIISRTVNSCTIQISQTSTLDEIDVMIFGTLA